MKAIEFNINGLFEMVVINHHTKERMDDLTTLSVLDNLQQGEYVLSLNSNVIYDINDLQTPLYGFSLMATDNVDYDFDEI